MTLRAIADRVLSTLFEPPCPACERVNDRPLDGAICAKCWSEIVPLTPPLCALCGDPLPSWRSASLTAGVCPRCRRQPRAIRAVASVGPYDGALRAIVHALKYGGRVSAAPPLSALMREAAAGVLDGADAVVPVPLHPLREWSRGFNQAVLLARGLGPPVLPLLTRIVHTAPQVALPAAKRHRNVRNAFALTASRSAVMRARTAGTEERSAGTLVRTAGTGVRSAVMRVRTAGTGVRSAVMRVRTAGVEVRSAGTRAGSAATGVRSAGTSVPASQAPLGPLQDLTLVLVDDVMTTGATLDACARVLVEAGAREVRAVTAARVVTSRPLEPGR